MAQCRDTDFSHANLTGADLRMANLWGSLRGANLSGADLRDADLSDVDLNAADFTDAKIGWTTFGNVDLSDAIGLSQVNHAGPSTIGIDTLYKSKGRIHETFMHGAGVPSTLIAFAKSLTESPFEFYSCFISLIPDFSEWRDQSKYEAAFNRLLAGLQASTGTVLG